MSISVQYTPMSAGYSNMKLLLLSLSNLKTRNCIFLSILAPSQAKREHKYAYQSVKLSSFCLSNWSTLCVKTLIEHFDSHTDN